jgi:hypothetical protein
MNEQELKDAELNYCKLDDANIAYYWRNKELDAELDETKEKLAKAFEALKEIEARGCTPTELR